MVDDISVAKWFADTQTSGGQLKWNETTRM